jgi:hypothetical protein
MEQVLPGADDEGSDPIIDAGDLRYAGTGGARCGS